ncbi:c-type cytochrome [Spirosoma validum]|uniref:Cytochrome c n=1 Tax=Spirosoma validum TaxID=2771355 RepID=A0A927B5R5_9BACT|nr:cytochrome c [Spirosoma validum]MBD2755894.1 cytochrome c [Spirosoma validum]
MLRKLAKWTGIVLGTLVLLLLAGYFLIARSIAQRIDKTYSFTNETLTIPNDSATVSRGEHLAVIKGCTDCHGTNLSGKIMIEDDALGRLSSSNLTKGKGGLPADYSTTDWVRALRHGVSRAGKPLLFMPSHETTMLSEQDMAAVIAYCHRIPSVDHELPANKIGPVVNVMAYLDKMPLLSVEKIDHNRSMVAKVDTVEGVAMGKYLAVSCSGCHQPTFKGGEPAAPGFPPSADLTRTGNVGKWTQAQFIATLRTGKTPSGHQLNNEYMPWKMTAQYDQKELASLYQYFRSLK